MIYLERTIFLSKHSARQTCSIVTHGKSWANSIESFIFPTLTLTLLLSLYFTVNICTEVCTNNIDSPANERIKSISRSLCRCMYVSVCVCVCTLYILLNFISINILTFINCDKRCIIPTYTKPTHSLALSFSLSLSLCITSVTLVVNSVEKCRTRTFVSWGKTIASLALSLVAVYQCDYNGDVQLISKK